MIKLWMLVTKQKKAGGPRMTRGKGVIQSKQCTQKEIWCLPPGNVPFDIVFSF